MTQLECKHIKPKDGQDRFICDLSKGETLVLCQFCLMTTASAIMSQMVINVFCPEVEDGKTK